MACSAVTLSFATITAVVAVACLAIAFGTDNWYEIRVNRTYIEQREPPANPRDFDEDIRYFSRDIGLFRVCFPDGEKPKRAPLYMSPVQTECLNIDYYIPQNQENENTKKFTDQRWERIRKMPILDSDTFQAGFEDMARSVIGMYIVGFFFVFLSFFTGVAGCWKRSKGNILATGLLQMLAALVDAGAMGLWHGVHYYDYQKLTDEASYYNWPDVLKMGGVTQFFYGWSYILAWIGVGMCLLTSVLFLCAACCVVHEKKAEQAKNMQYLMPMADKRQPYGYGYAYPGPYYIHGSQYGGPYSY